MKPFEAVLRILACNLPNIKVTTAKGLGKNYINVRPPLVRHLFRNRLFGIYYYRYLNDVFLVFFLDFNDG